MWLSGRTLTIAGFLVVVLLSGGFIIWKKLRPSVTPPASIAICRFQTATGAEREEGLALSLAENLKAALIGTAKVDILDGQTAPSKDPDSVARAISAASYVTGTVRLNGPLVHASVTLKKIGEDKPLWTGEYDGTAVNWFAVEDTAASQLLSSLWRELPAVQHHTADPEADQFYWRGRFAMEAGTREALRNAGTFFERAAAKDQADALAWAGLADVSLLLSEWDADSRLALVPRVRLVAHRAITLDPTIAEPHTALGLIAENYDWDWDQALQELKRAADLNPNDALGRLWYGEFLVERGKIDEGMLELKRAAHLEPVSPLIKGIYAKCLYLTRKYDEAIRMAQSALALNRDSVVARRWLAAAYSQKSDPRSSSPDLTDLGTASSALAQAAAAVSAGNRDRALELLEGAYRDHETGLITLKLDPAFDPVRTDPRFISLLSKLHLR